jgi:hypothetical protein
MALFREADEAHRHSQSLQGHEPLLALFDTALLTLSSSHLGSIVEI